MLPYLRLSLLIIIIIAPVSSKEVAYVYGEDGGRELEDVNLTLNEKSEVVAYAVSLGEGASSQIKTKSTSTDEIKKDISRKVNQLNRDVIKEGSKQIGNISGDKRIDQICSIYEYQVSNWVYKADWKGLEYFQYSNESLEYGRDVGKSGKGDCDDFAILLAALVESVGGTPRIIFAYGPQGGHAYAQVYIGQDTEYDSRVSRMIDWLKSKYGVKDVYAIKDDVTNDVWLNLDWWKDPVTNKDVVKHPGGPLFNATDFVLAYYDGNRDNWTSPTPVPESPKSWFSISNENPNALENVTFDASESKDEDTEIKAWNWDFGDGQKGIGKIAVHHYLQGGRYNVTLTVTDNDEVEKSSQFIQEIEVNGLPIPFIEYTPKDPQLTDSIDFNASKSRDWDSEGSIKSYYWEFGDGETSPRKHPSRYEYESNGSYMVNLTVEDNKGALNTTSITVKVNLPPQAVMRIEPNQQHNAGDEVRFDATASTDGDGTIRSWQWDFGDRANSSGIQVSHVYSGWGEYPVVLNVTDDNNASHQTEAILKLNARPIADFSFNPPDPEEGDEITFDASSSKDHDGKIDYYWWDLDETKTEGNKACYPDHTYKKPGVYNITLTVRDNLGAINSTTRSIKVNPPSLEDLFQEGQVLVNEYKYEDAIIKFDAILQQDSYNQPAMFYKGFCLNKLGEYEAALKSLNASLEANPWDDYAWNEKANALAGLGRYDEALYSSNKSIELNPNMWFVWNDRGLMLYAMNQYQDAANAYDKALSLNPSENDKKDLIRQKEIALSKVPGSNELQSTKGKGFNSYDIRSQVATGDFLWNAYNFAGFYYDIDYDLGTEELTTTISDGNKLMEPDGIIYSTTAQKNDFEFKGWGSYKVMGFQGNKCFAGYVSDDNVNDVDEILLKKSIDDNPLDNKQIEAVLLDNDNELTVTSGIPLKLEEGYELAIKSIDIDGNKVYLDLSKDGVVVDSKVISPSKDNPTMADKTYYYRKTVGDCKDLAIIAAHFKNAFRGAEENLATVDGLWQISEVATEVKVDTEYDKMRIASVSADTITMDNKDNTVTLWENKDIDLMGDLKIVTSDQTIVDDANPLRYYIVKVVTEPGTYEVRGCVALENFEWSDQNFAGFYYDIDDDLGTEKITTTIIEGNKLEEPDGIVYTTTAQKKDFEFGGWGFYSVIAFQAKKYFTGYLDDEAIDDADEVLFKESIDENTLSDEQIEEILIDDANEITITNDTILELKEGYELVMKSVDIEGNRVFLDLYKNGSIVDNNMISPSRDRATMADRTYLYRKDVGNSKGLAIISVHFKNVFRGTEKSLATIDGLWQISENATKVEVDTEYDKMRIASVTADTITMDNKNNTVNLRKNRDITLMGDIKIKTADQDVIDDANPLRYYIYKEVNI